MRLSDLDTEARELVREFANQYGLTPAQAIELMDDATPAYGRNRVTGHKLERRSTTQDPAMHLVAA